MPSAKSSTVMGRGRGSCRGRTRPRSRPEMGPKSVTPLPASSTVSHVAAGHRTCPRPSAPVAVSSAPIRIVSSAGTPVQGIAANPRHGGRSPFARREVPSRRSLPSRPKSVSAQSRPARVSSPASPDSVIVRVAAETGCSCCAPPEIMFVTAPHMENPGLPLPPRCVVALRCHNAFVGALPQGSGRRLKLPNSASLSGARPDRVVARAPVIASFHCRPAGLSLPSRPRSTACRCRRQEIVAATAVEVVHRRGRRSGVIVPRTVDLLPLGRAPVCGAVIPHWTFAAPARYASDRRRAALPHVWHRGWSVRSSGAARIRLTVEKFRISWSCRMESAIARRASDRAMTDPSWRDLRNYVSSFGCRWRCSPCPKGRVC